MNQVDHTWLNSHLRFESMSEVPVVVLVTFLIKHQHYETCKFS
jgi:hypothetical protein